MSLARYLFVQSWLTFRELPPCMYYSDIEQLFECNNVELSSSNLIRMQEIVFWSHLLDSQKTWETPSIYFILTWHRTTLKGIFFSVCQCFVRLKYKVRDVNHYNGGVLN